jgi:enamine deaminase RidA (YjgF/YER057c/UK114 family)
MSTLATIVNPPSLSKPVGFSHGVVTTGGRTLYIAGQVATDASGQVVGRGDLVEQFRQVCLNLAALLEASGGRLEHVVKLTVFVLSKAEYKARAREIGGVYRELFGRHYPAMTLVEVSALFEDDYAIEIEGVAVLPA